MTTSTVRFRPMRLWFSMVPVLGLTLGLTQVGPCPGGGGPFKCLSDADCDDGDGCTTDTCNLSTYECSNEADCDEDHCVEGECVDCLTNEECAENEVCSNGECVPMTEEQNFAVFTHPEPTVQFSTIEVRDVNDEIVYFNLDNNSVVAKDTGIEYDVGLWTVDGNFLRGGAFEVQFGTVGGENRAYFTEVGPGTICDFTFTATTFTVSPTNVSVPHE